MVQLLKQITARNTMTRLFGRRVKSATRSLKPVMASTNQKSNLMKKYASASVASKSFTKWSTSVHRSYASSSQTIAERIAEQVKAAPVVIYMKGTPKSPQCGFSRAVVDVMRREALAKYDYYNILEDEVLRQGIKDYSNWPTIPQVYIGGEFVGGCDIILEMHGEGTLAEALQKAGAEIQEH